MLTESLRDTLNQHGEEGGFHLAREQVQRVDDSCEGAAKGAAIG